MTTRTMKGFLRAAIFGGGVCLLPAVGLAAGGPGEEQVRPNVPDHAQAEARGGAQGTVPAAERTEGTPDHAQAEARGGAQTTLPAAERERATDHATVESRGADTN